PGPPCSYTWPCGPSALPWGPPCGPPGPTSTGPPEPTLLLCGPWLVITGPRPRIPGLSVTGPATGPIGEPMYWSSIVEAAQVAGATMTVSAARAPPITATRRTQSRVMTVPTTSAATLTAPMATV